MYDLKVDGMHCGGCVNSVIRAVQSIDSHAQTDIDLKKKRVRVHTEVDLQTVVSAITSAGYTVQAASTV
jgi:copper chaperone CopZ